MVNKLITNRSAVNAKYGNKSDLFWAQVTRLIAADRQRGIITELVCVDDAEQMLTINAPVVTDKSNCKQNKDTIDGIYKGYNPNFIVILGAHDLIPFQSLENTTSDVDLDVPSDLPYACDNEYSSEIASFRAPSRMVSRLPDVYGTVTDFTMTAFIKTVDRVISMYADDVDAYKSFWNVCTTQRTDAMNATKNYFASRDVAFNIHISPPAGPDYPSDMYTMKTHHHIVHGSENDNTLYGESSDENPTYPDAVVAPYVENNIENGTIVLERACYGAQLYDPADGVTKELPLANMYVSSGATMIGSTKITYSNRNGLSPADDMVLYFMDGIMDSMTAGEAMLSARQRYLVKYHRMNTIEQKIYGEYQLYGYSRAKMVQTKQGKEEICINLPEYYRQRADRLESEASYAVYEAKWTPPDNVRTYIGAYLAEKGIEQTPEIRCYSIEGGEEFKKKLADEAKTVCEYSVSVSRTEYDEVIYIFTETNGEITSVEEYVRG